MRFKLAKKRRIEPPPELHEGKIPLVPFAEVPHLDLPLERVRTFGRLPKSEKRGSTRALVHLALWLTRRFSPMQPGVGEIDDDIEHTLGRHVAKGYRKAFRAPVRPAAFAGPDPDLADLAVRGPYALFLERDDTGDLHWDLRVLGRAEHYPDLCNLGLRVVFGQNGGGPLRALRIESDELGTVLPGEHAWSQASRLAVCAATTHVALTRHFNYVHLVAADHWDTVARSELYFDDPFFRLLWPHISNSLYTNYGITRVQMYPDGEFVDIYSFTHRGLLEYFDDMYDAYDTRVMDPELDWRRRGLDGTGIEHPTHENLVDVFTVMHDHARRYLHAYFDSDDALRRDRGVNRWIHAMQRAIPNGIGPVHDDLTCDGLARLVGAFMFEGNTILVPKVDQTVVASISLECSRPR